MFEQEPLPKESPLWSLDGVIISAHCAIDDVDTYLQSAQYNALGQPTSISLGAGVINTSSTYHLNGANALALQSIVAKNHAEQTLLRFRAETTPLDHAVEHDDQGEQARILQKLQGQGAEFRHVPVMTAKKPFPS